MGTDDAQRRMELRDAAQRGVNEYLGSTRGANLFGASSTTTPIGNNELQVRVGFSGMMSDYFTIKVSRGG